MNDLAINIGWEYFLGIMGALLGIAWYAGSKFSKIETSIEWMKDAIHELKTASDNEKSPAFEIKSPVNLNKRGEDWLRKSGLKKYIDENKEIFLVACEEKREANPYDIQEHIFKFFDEVKFEKGIETQLKEFAFKNGTTMNIMRRVAGIYFRNLCLQEFGLNIEDIDRHTESTK